MCKQCLICLLYALDSLCPLPQIQMLKPNPPTPFGGKNFGRWLGQEGGVPLNEISAHQCLRNFLALSCSRKLELEDDLS